jgi:hypothetical protein
VTKKAPKGKEREEENFAADSEDVVNDVKQCWFSRRREASTIGGTFSTEW